MKQTKRCPACGQERGKAWPALVAPFIASLVLRAPVSSCSLIECDACGLRFFDGRFEPEELLRLYEGYRGDAYFQARHRFEPWYGERHNTGTGHDPDVITARKAFLVSFLKAHGITSAERVLDYGGDSGQFIPDEIGAEKHVFEVSSAPPTDGVKKISEESLLEPGSYDLILLNHVLEHVPEPIELLHKLAVLLKPERGVLYIEVPHERYHIWSGFGKVQQGYLAWLSRHEILLRMADFLSTTCRVALGVVPPLGFPKLHEHINLFSEPSLRKACERAGMAVEDCVAINRPDGRVISSLARARAEA